MALADPSVVVTIGDPRSVFVAHHATVAVIGVPAVSFTATRFPPPPVFGQPTPPPFTWRTTYVPMLVV